MFQIPTDWDNPLRIEEMIDQNDKQRSQADAQEEHICGEVGVTQLLEKGRLSSRSILRTVSVITMTMVVMGTFRMPVIIIGAALMFG